MTTITSPLPRTTRGDAIAAVISSQRDPFRTIEQYIDFAVALGDLGVHVTVLARGTRGPFSDFRSDEQKVSDAAQGKTLQSWYLGTPKAERLRSYALKALADTGAIPNVGVHLSPSGLIAIDADNEGDVISWARFAHNVLGFSALFQTDSPGKVEDGVWVHRDGAHAFFITEGVNHDNLRTTTEKRELPGTDLAAEGRAGWDVKLGPNAGVLLPPSVRTEGQYVWNPRHGYTIPAAPFALIERLMAPAPRSIRDWDDDDFEFNRTVNEAMDAVQWSDAMSGVALHDGTDRDGCGVWTRPGGTHRSMVAHDGCAPAHGSTCVTVYSSTILAQYPMLEDLCRERNSKNFSKWEITAAFQFGGDMAAAAREYGFSRPSRSTISVDDTPFSMSVNFRDAQRPRSASNPFIETVTPAALSAMAAYDGTTSPDWGSTCHHGLPLSKCPPCASAVSAVRRRVILEGIVK